MDLITEGLCKNCTILAGKTRLTFEDGTEAIPSTGVYIHHIISYDLSKPANLPITKCGAGQTQRLSLGAEFLAQGEDSSGQAGILFTSADGKYDSGFYLGAGDKVMNQVDLVNYNNDTRKVFVNYDIEYMEGKVGADAAATLMSVTGCTNATRQAEQHAAGKPPVSAIKLNQTGIAVTESPKFNILEDGKIISASKLVVTD
jgi:hypothetical protein